MTLTPETYVIARTASGRPTLQHKLRDGTGSYTGCGHEITGWSRAYMNNRIEQILCLQPGCRS
jgi:hypothetical protein